MAKDRWDFEKDFDKMRKQMNQLWDNFFPDSFDRGDVPLLGSSKKNQLLDTSFKTPRTDLYETDKEVIAKLEVPGIKKEDIKLEIKNGMLNLKAENKQEKEDKDEKKGYYRFERRYSGFARSLSLPADVDENKVKADYKDGILEVRLSKKKPSKEDEPKYIEIK